MFIVQLSFGYYRRPASSAPGKPMPQIDPFFQAKESGNDLSWPWVKVSSYTLPILSYVLQKYGHPPQDLNIKYSQTGRTSTCVTRRLVDNMRRYVQHYYYSMTFLFTSNLYLDITALSSSTTIQSIQLPPSTPHQR
jgi:hypothetical protein